MRSIGVKTKCPGKYTEINILGDTVIKIKYPRKIVDKIEKFYKKFATTQDIDPKELTKLVHTSCELKLIIFRNKEMADSLRMTYDKLLG